MLEPPKHGNGDVGQDMSIQFCHKDVIVIS